MTVLKNCFVNQIGNLLSSLFQTWVHFLNTYLRYIYFFYRVVLLSDPGTSWKNNFSIYHTYLSVHLRGWCKVTADAKVEGKSELAPHSLFNISQTVNESTIACNYTRKTCYFSKSRPV